MWQSHWGSGPEDNACLQISGKQSPGWKKNARTQQSPETFYIKAKGIVSPLTHGKKRWTPSLLFKTTRQDVTARWRKGNNWAAAFCLQQDPFMTKHKLRSEDLQYSRKHAAIWKNWFTQEIRAHQGGADADSWVSATTHLPPLLVSNNRDII